MKFQENHKIHYKLNKNRIKHTKFWRNRQVSFQSEIYSILKEKCKFSQTNRQGEKKNNWRPELSGLAKKNQWRKLRKTRVGSSKNSSKFMDFSQNWQNQNRKYTFLYLMLEINQGSFLGWGIAKGGRDFRCGKSSGREWCCIG